MKAYSMDLRERIIEAWQAGETQSAIAERYAVSLRTVKRLIQQYREEGHVRPKQRTEWRREIGTEALVALEAQLAKHPDATLQQHVDLWAESQKVTVSVTTMWRAIQRVKWTRKKR